MTLRQLRQALAEAQVRPVKSLGQNFLHDQNLAHWIVDQARIENSDFVVEIGPGLGALTSEILGRGAQLLALEKDQRLVNFLRARFRNSRLELRHCDALEFDARALFAERNVKLIGNLPYYIGSQLLLHFCDYPSAISFSMLMLQEEMARRLSAAPRTRDYGALTLRMQLNYEIKYLRKIARTVFFPEPEISSAIVKVVPRDELSVGVLDHALFCELVRLGFSQRRKQLRKLLAKRVPDWPSAAGKIGLSMTARAEELSREQWIDLSNLIGREEIEIGPKREAEFFPVVDENDNFIRLLPRDQVHGDNLRHRAVHILILNSAGEVLLQKRSARKDRHPLLWDSSAAGHVEDDETYEQSAGRELREELGIATKLLKLGKLAASKNTDNEFVEVFRGQAERPFRVARREISAVKFFPVEIVDRWTRNKPEEFAPAFLEVWRLFRKQ